MKNVTEVADKVPSQVRLKMFNDGVSDVYTLYLQEPSGFGVFVTGTSFHDRKRARRAGQKIAEALGSQFWDETTIALRSFTDSDWDAFAGCEEPFPGAEPKIADQDEITLDGEQAVVVVHGGGIGVEQIGGADKSFGLNCGFRWGIEFVTERMPKVLTSEWLKANGFQVVR